MDLRDIYIECFTIDELISLINAYSTIINTIGPDEGFICKLDHLMNALKEREEMYHEQ